MCRSKDWRAHIYMHSVFPLTLTFSCELLPSLGIQPSVICKLFTFHSSPLKLTRHIGTIGMMLRRSSTKKSSFSFDRTKPMHHDAWLPQIILVSDSWPLKLLCQSNQSLQEYCLEVPLSNSLVSF